MEIRSWKQKVGVFAALMFASAVCLALYIVRVVYTGELTHFFLNWNLFLAWIPLLCALAAYGIQALRSKLRYAAALPCAAAWLLFFPNAPYLLTDLLHLSAGEGAPAWFDLVMILSFAWTGLLLGFVSLYLMQDLVSQALGRLAGWLFVLATLGLGSFGIYLGRFLRWNSWDLFFNPLSLLADIWDHLRHPLAHPRTFVFSLLFSAFFLSAYLILFSFAHLRAERREAR